MKISNLTKGTILVPNCMIADTFQKRLMGLMGKKSLEYGKGLLITPCNSIHMFFMRFPIDVVFVDRSNTVLYVLEDLKPWRVSKIVHNAHGVIELPVGIIQASETLPGDKLAFGDQ